MNENVITMEQVLRALGAAGWTPNPEGGSVDIAQLVGRMTGLDMTKYEVRSLPNAHAWEVVKRAD